MLIGYARVSTKKHILNDQLKKLHKIGCTNVYIDEFNEIEAIRPELRKLIDAIRPTDTLIVPDLTKLSTSLEDLVHIVHLINERGAHFKSMNESWFDTTKMEPETLIQILEGILQFDNDLHVDISEDLNIIQEEIIVEHTHIKVIPKRQQQRLENAVQLYNRNNFSLFK